MTDLPVNIDAVYQNRSPGDAAHQQHHDRVHATVNDVDNAYDVAVADGYTGTRQAWLEQIQANANATSGQGLFSARPVAGNQGALYYATDQDRTYRDDGTEWSPINEVRTSVLDHGAVTGGDLYDALTAANTALAAGDNRGTIVIPAGYWTLSGKVVFGENVSLVGAGKSATSIYCSDASAQLAFGTRDTAIRGGRCGGFTINANDKATTPLYWGYNVERLLSDVRAFGGVTESFRAESCQNCTFLNLECVDGGDYSMVLDTGINNLLILGGTRRGAGIAQLVIQNTHATSPTTSPNPRQVKLVGGLNEDGDAVQASAGQVLIRAGHDLSFLSVQTSCAVGSTAPAFAIDRTVVGSQVDIIRFIGGQLRAADGAAPCMSVKGNGATCEVFIEGGTHFRQGSVAIEADDDAIIHLGTHYLASIVPALFSGIDVTAQEVIRRNDRPVWPFTSARDGFDRVDGAIGTSETGQAWSTFSGTWTVTSRRATQATSGFRAVVLDAGVADGKVRAMVQRNGLTNLGLVCRGIDASNYLYAQVGSGFVRLSKYDAGVLSELVAVSGLTFPAADWFEIDVSFVNDRIVTIVRDIDGRVVIRMAHTLSAADQTKYGAATLCGLGQNGGTPDGLWDAFEVRSAS